MAEWTFLDYLDERGSNPIRQWLTDRTRVPVKAKARIDRALLQLAGTRLWVRPSASNLDGYAGIVEIRVRWMSTSIVCLDFAVPKIVNLPCCSQQPKETMSSIHAMLPVLLSREWKLCCPIGAEPVNTVTAKLELLENCKDREYREALNVENVYATVCAQIRALREQRDLSQRDLGRIVGMAQERISILEDPNAETKPTLNTLLRFAAGFDIGLDVRFVPFATVLDRSTRTDEALLKVDRFDDELPELERSLRSEQASAAAGSLIDIGQFKASKNEPVPLTAYASASITPGNSTQGGAMSEARRIPPASLGLGANMATGMPQWKS